MNVHPGLIASTIAGSGIGIANGFMTKGEELENQGASGWQQLSGSTVSGFTHGMAGAGIGVGVSGAMIALKKILGK